MRITFKVINIWNSRNLNQKKQNYESVHRFIEALTRCKTQCKWRYSSPSSICSTIFFICSGIRIIALSFTKCSKSVSMKSNTSWIFVLCPITSKSCNRIDQIHFISFYFLFFSDIEIIILLFIKCSGFVVINRK